MIPDMKHIFDRWSWIQLYEMGLCRFRRLVPQFSQPVVETLF